jgi:hypothetical protein
VAGRKGREYVWLDEEKDRKCGREKASQERRESVVGEEDVKSVSKGEGKDICRGKGKAE